MNRLLKKRHLVLIVLFAVASLLSLQLARMTEQPVIAKLGPPVTAAGDEPIEPIPMQVSLNMEKVVLGKQLFHDPKLSKTNNISCASCHDLSMGGTDRLPVSIGINGEKGTINSPTVFNNSFHFKQFWDGRASSLEEQIEGPVHAGNEMGSSWPEIIGKLKQSPEYVNAFNELYDSDISADHIKDAIATFERSLYTPNSKFDQFLRGNADALTQDEKEGYRRFKGFGCVACHQGVLLGGNMYQKFGVFGDYIKDRGDETKADLGRYNVTGKEDDRYMFKVPSLRNIALTAPYFHDGSSKTLDEAVKIMVKYQLGREADQEDVDLIIKFLNTLNGEIKEVA